MEGQYIFGIAMTLSAIALLGLLARSFTKKSRSRFPFPPGPKPLPLIGNLLDIPHEKEWLAYNQLAQKHGDIVHLEALGQHIVVLNSAKAANDLLERRSAIYSNRPVAIMSSKLMGIEEWNLGVFPYGETWRKTRRMFHSQMHTNAAPRFQSVQKLQARVFLKQLLEDSTELPVIVRGSIGASILDVVYGVQVNGMTDRHIMLPEKVVQMISAAVLPGAYLVDLIPLLRYVPAWFPGAEFQRFAALARKLTEEMLEEPLQEVERAVASGKAQESVTSALIEQSPSKEPEEYRETVKMVSGIAYAAGADTTVSTSLSFFLAMANYPEVQAKAQVELDAVIGLDRLPEFSDAANLPYISAIILELFRWQPVIPLGVPHATTADDEYNGYFIPKNAIVMGNIWAILHDPEEYPNPEEFQPERFLKDGALTKEVRDPRSAFFGFGRRICPGRHFAEQSLFITVASVLSTFSISPPLNEHGKPVPCKVDMCSGFISHPLPFKCIVKPRSPRATNLINQPLPERGL